MEYRYSDWIKMKAIVYFAIIVFFVCGFLLFIYEPKQKDTLELARQHVSAINQKLLYNKIGEYYKVYQEIPASLSTLVEKGFVGESEIFAPPVDDEQNYARPFNYYPENYGKSNAVLLSDVRIAISRHCIKREAVEIVTFGDGMLACGAEKTTEK